MKENKVNPAFDLFIHLVSAKTAQSVAAFFHLRIFALARQWLVVARSGARLVRIGAPLVRLGARRARCGMQKSTAKPRFQPQNAEKAMFSASAEAEFS